MTKEDFETEIDRLQKGAKQQLLNNDPNYNETLNQLTQLQKEYKRFLKQTSHAKNEQSN
jgi:hypothetical protein